MSTRSIFLSCALLCAGTVHAQVPIPPAFVGLQDVGEVPYASGASSIGPNGPIDSPLEDADTRAYSTAFWQVVDNGGTDLTPVTNFVWTAPTIVDMFSSEPGADPDPWFGGLTLFEYIYGHRLQLFGGPQSIEELIESDPAIALTWRHWTVYHQLATANSIDSEAHFRHAELVLDTFTPSASTTMRGVPFYNGPVLISDRLEITDMSTWFLWDPGPNQPPAPLLLTTGTQRALDQSKDTLKGISGLYKEDGAAFLGFGTSGFDCDDFADAFGALVEKLDSTATATSVRCTWKESASGGGKSKSAHRITRITSGNEYWLCDPQTGGLIGPFNIEIALDASPLLGPYGPIPGTEHTGRGQRDLGDRGWGEPPAWNESPDMVNHFDMTTMPLGLMSSCFFPS